MIETDLKLDSSKMSDYMRCPRYCFYRHELGWTSSRTNKDLVFGESWHRAMERVSIDLAEKTKSEKEIVQDAMIAFCDYYRQSYTPDTDMENFPKNPGNAELAIKQHLSAYQELLIPVRIHDRWATEIFGTVPINSSRVMLFRIDKICKLDSGYIFVDYKTGSQNNAAYQSRWQLSMQMLLYYHVINCMYDPKQVHGGKVEMTLFKKGGNEHLRIPINKSIDMMNEWLFTVNSWYDAIEDDHVSLLEAVEKQQPLRCFKRNDSGCAAYGKICPYYDFCLSWSDPLSKIDTIPDGMIEEHWTPFKQMKEGDIHIDVETK